MGMELGVHPLLLDPGEGETTTNRPERTIRILCDFEQVIVSWFRYDPGEDGPEPHVHRQHSGTFAGAPPNVVHTFKNSSDGTATFLNIHAPSRGFGDVLRGRGREHFDQFDPPDDGGRPFTDAVLSPGGEGERVGRETTSHLIKAELPELSIFEMA